jgi:2-polyprenyl-3-methyl-5-hydroxy-6-metoxy-1,4-benzoquinol methylase
MLKKYFHTMFAKAAELNHQNILNLSENNTKARFIDLGCDDGLLTQLIGNKIQTSDVYGADIVTKRLDLAGGYGIKTKKQDLNSKFNMRSNYFDVVTANQVIEHINNSDIFISEVYRIIKPGGYAIISTENASSWINIMASLFGWQIFSLTNFSQKKRSLGNPLSIHRGEDTELNSWLHVRIYNINGLKEYFKVFGFKVEKITGSGYFPFPAEIGKIDVIHAHFITFKIRKPLNE